MATRFLADYRTVNFRALVPLDLLRAGRAGGTQALVAVPHAHRDQAHHERSRSPTQQRAASDPHRDVRCRRVLGFAQRYRADRPRPRRRRRPRRTARQAPLRVLDGRRAGLASMRLRRAARPRADRHRRRGRRRARSISGRRVGGSGWRTSCERTRSRTAGSTPSPRTPRSACRSMPASTVPPPPSSPTSGWSRCG